MLNKPLFSIVIPTRNRAHLLRYALQSALEQKFVDYEIIVSDNYCTDNTPDVVRELADARVRYVRSERPLAMPDSWEFALSHARGEYVTFLSDDDAFSPGVLERVSQVLIGQDKALVGVRPATYFSDDWYEQQYRNVLTIPYFTKQVTHYESKRLLLDLYSSLSDTRIPKMLMSFCHQDIIEQIKKKLARLFWSTCPDYSAAALLLSHTQTYIYMEEPIYIGGATPTSIGSSGHYKPNSQSVLEYMREFGTEKIFTQVPLSRMIVTNNIAETLLTVKAQVPELFKDIDFGWKEYFAQYYNGVRLHEKNGVNVSAAIEEFFYVLNQQPITLKEAVLKAIHSQSEDNHKASLKRGIRRNISRSQLLTRLDLMLRPRKPKPNVIRGEEAGFSNILECARKFDTLVENFHAATSVATVSA